MLAGGTISRTAHFALHCVSLDRHAVTQGKPLPTIAYIKSLFPIEDVWVGAMVPKRWAKRAVTRNTIKRQIYNVSSRMESSLKPMAHVVRLRSGFDRTHFFSATSDALKTAIDLELNQLFSKATGTQIKVPA